jgi:hypothetical protein
MTTALGVEFSLWRVQASSSPGRPVCVFDPELDALRLGAEVFSGSGPGRLPQRRDDPDLSVLVQDQFALAAIFRKALYVVFDGAQRRNDEDGEDGGKMRNGLHGWMRRTDSRCLSAFGAQKTLLCVMSHHSFRLTIRHLPTPQRSKGRQMDFDGVFDPFTPTYRRLFHPFESHALERLAGTGD